MMFGKMQKIFWYDHSNACQKCSKVLLHNAPMWIRTKQKIGFFLVFSKTKLNFAVWILHLHKKCDLLRYIMLRRLRSFQRGTVGVCSSIGYKITSYQSWRRTLSSWNQTRAALLWFKLGRGQNFLLFALFSNLLTSYVLDMGKEGSNCGKKLSTSQMDGPFY